ncbi:MAG TPA: PH domain-containing protein [Vicinamibacterales bacterium]
MPSERRLHPLSILFALGDQLRAFALPAIALFFTAGSKGWGWEVWTLPLLIPSLVAAVLRYVSFRYRYEPGELVIRSGILFRNERHVPYARIQNLDAVQNVLHRLFGVVEVRVETGAGTEPEARMRVLPLSALQEMRAHVFGNRAVEPIVEAAPGETQASTAPAVRTLLHLTPRELAICGLIQNKGGVLLAAGLGLLWEWNVADRMFGWLPIPDWRPELPERLDPDRLEAVGRGALHDAIVAFTGAAGSLPLAILAAALFVLMLLALVRLLSVVWTLVQLYDFRLTRTGEDLRTEYGLLTRVAATVPLRRVQTLTIREGVLHRLFGYTSVRVDSAGGDGGETAANRAWIAPIVRRAALPALVRGVLAGVDVDALDWQPVHPRAFARRLRRSVVLSALVLPAVVGPLGWWALAIFAAAVAWSAVHARHWIAWLGWTGTDHIMAMRSGWLWRQITIAPLTKLQVISTHATPFDRRAGMATLRVDTAGAKDATHRIVVPYLPADTAAGLQAVLTRHAAATEFAW